MIANRHAVNVTVILLEQLMRFKISTVFTIIAFAAVCLCWYVDHQDLASQISESEALHAEREAKINIGSSLSASADAKFELFDELGIHEADGKFKELNDNQDYRLLVNTICIREMMLIHEYQKEIELVGTIDTGSWDARLNARDALSAMKCKNVDSFFEIARSIEQFGRPRWYDRIHNTQSQEHQSLRLFISDTLAVYNQIFDGTFDPDPRNKR